MTDSKEFTPDEIELLSIIEYRILKKWYIKINSEYPIYILAKKLLSLMVTSTVKCRVWAGFLAYLAAVGVKGVSLQKSHYAPATALTQIVYMWRL